MIEFICPIITASCVGFIIGLLIGVRAERKKNG